MQIGMYRKRMSLLWDNKYDKDFKEAIKELRFKKNNIQQLVVKIDGPLSYSTKKVIEWQKNQYFSCGQQFTHKLSSRIEDKVTTVSRKMPYKFRHFVPSLIVLDPEKFMDYPTPAWERPVLPKIKQEIKIDVWNEPMLLKSLLEAYQIEQDYVDSLDFYIINKFPIVRLPQDPVVYEWFCELEIAPRYSSLEDGLSLYDDSNITYIGKESILDDAENYASEDAYYY